MAAGKLDMPALEGEGRGLFLREILAVILAIFTAMVLLALASGANAADAASNWIGPFGGYIASSLNFILGQYVVWLLPLMLAALTIRAWRKGIGDLGRGWFGLGWGWLRGIGGAAMLTGMCACLALCAPEGEPAEAFRNGGMLGNWLVDAKGCDLGALLGRAGALLAFGGAALIGAILFTDTLLRDAVRALLRGAGRIADWRAWLRWPAWLHMPQWRVFDWASAAWESIGAFGRMIQRAWFRTIVFVRGIDFDRDRESRVMPIGPIVELTALPGTGFRRASMDEDEAAPRARRQMEDDEDEEIEEKPAKRPRSSRVMGGSLFNRAPKEDSPRRAAPSAYEEERPALPQAAPRRAASQPAPMPALSQTPLAKARKAVQKEMELFPDEYRLPPLSLLTPPPDTMYTMSPAERESIGKRIEALLAEFKIEVQVVDVVQGPVVTRFALHVAAGVRVSKILQLESELAMALRAQHVRILAPIPGQAAVGIEVPNPRPNPVVLRELLESDEFRESKPPLSFVLGKGISGDAVVSDLAKMPHLLIAGATGSGKSVCLNTIIASLLFRNRPDEVKFVMIDPKRVELSIFQAIPHLVAPVVCEPKKAAAALAWCVDQMEQRYKLLAEMGVRNIDGYNAIVRSTETARPHRKAIGRNDLKPMPHYVIIIDELADLMLVAKNEVEEYVIRLAQMARAVGMHLILATQRPSVNVITGLIKANFPSRIAFQVSSKVDSRTILDMNGAEALMGRGDMLYSPGGVKPFRIQGAFVSDAEVERLADTIREQQPATYEKEDFEPAPTPAERAKAQLMAEAMPGGAMARGGYGDEGSYAGGDVYDPNRPEMQAGDGYAGWDDEDAPEENAGAVQHAARAQAAGRGNAGEYARGGEDHRGARGNGEEFGGRGREGNGGARGNSEISANAMRDRGASGAARGGSVFGGAARGADSQVAASRSAGSRGASSRGASSFAESTLSTRSTASTPSTGPRGNAPADYDNPAHAHDHGNPDDDTENGPGRMASRGFAGAAPLTAADMNALTDEDLYDVALRLILESKKASVSYIQRRLKIGYARAGRLMDMMEERGIVGPYQGSKPRDLRVDPDAYLRQ